MNLKATLRPYQERGYQWLYNNSKVGFGSIIADDMGLGKTLQVLSLLLRLKQEGRFIKRKALIVVPTTLITNWQKEIERLTLPTMAIWVRPSTLTRSSSNASKKLRVPLFCVV